MLSRALGPGNVCLRCRLRLQDRPRPLGLLKCATPRIQAISQRRYQHDDPFAKSFLSAFEDGGKPEPEKKPESEPRPEPKLKLKTESKPAYRGRVGNRRVMLASEDLTSQMLGKTAHTIVMRDDNNAKEKPEYQELPSDIPEEPSAAGVQASWESGQKEMTLEELLSNITELKPKSSLLPRNDIWSLANKLASGFTGNQLRSYRTEWLRREQEENRALSKKDRKTSRSKQQDSSRHVLQKYSHDWTDKSYSIIPQEQFTIPKDLQPKVRYAAKIIGEVWGVGDWESVEGVCAATIKVKSGTLAHLWRNGGQLEELLADFRHDLLQPSEYAVYDAENAILSLYARRAVIATMIDAIDKVPKTVNTETFRYFEVEKTDQSTMEKHKELVSSLSRLTPADAQLALRGKATNVSVSWFDDEKARFVQQHGLEDMCHIFWRLMYTAHLDSGKHLHLQHLAAKQTAQGFLDPDVITRGQGPWHYKTGKPWARWALPTAKASQSTSGSTETGLGDGLLGSLATPPTLSGSTAEAGAALWQQPQTELRTIFGHLLVDTQKDEVKDADRAEVSELPSELFKRDRVFWPVTPSLGGLAPLNHVSSQPASNTTLIFRFTVGGVAGDYKNISMASSSKSSSMHPEAEPRHILELHLGLPEELPEDGRLTWEASPHKEVRAIWGRAVHDMPMPSKPVDLRIEEAAVSILADPESIPELRDFVNNSQLNLASSDVLTPPVVKLPKASLPLTSEASDRKEAAKLQEETLDFIGLEVRSAIAVEYEGHNVTYTSVEAGLHGGRREELSLDMAGGHSAENGQAVVDTSKDLQEEYLDVAGKLVDGALIHWNVTPRHENSETPVGDSSPTAV